MKLMNSVEEQLDSERDKNALVDAISLQAASVCERECRRALGALVLSGSLARGEGTFVREGKQHRLLGDAEFFLVRADGATFPARFEVQRLSEEIETNLFRRGIVCRVEISPVDSKYLRTLPRRILSYELKRWGRVVAGESGILSLVPEFTSADILLEDAWRLLANRIVEQLEAAAAIRPGLTGLPENLYYRTLKLYLDMATSLLVFLGAYEPSYRERARALDRLAVAGAGGDGLLPFPLAAFSEKVRACTEVKLRGISSRTVPHEAWLQPSLEFWEEAVDYARELWRWELVRLTGADDKASALMKRWAKSQPMTRRLRGWAYVMRASGWIRSCRHWPRWMILCRRGSPRCLIYEAAADLLFRLPVWVKSGWFQWPDDTSARPAGSLPIVEAWNRSAGDWRDWAAQVATNYHRFIEKTVA